MVSQPDNIEHTVYAVSAMKTACGQAQLHGAGRCRDQRCRARWRTRRSHRQADDGGFGVGDSCQGHRARVDGCWRWQRCGKRQRADAGRYTLEMLRTMVGCQDRNPSWIDDQWCARCGHTEAGVVGAKNEAGAGSATGWRLSLYHCEFPDVRVGYPSFLYGTPSCAGTLNDRRATVSTIVRM